VFISL